jgi:outer membrane protein
MHKLFTVLTVVLLGLALATPASAQALKIAVVDLQTALNEVEEGKRAKKNLEQQMEQARLKLEREQAELEQMRDELQAQAVMLSESAIRAKESEFNVKATNFQQEMLQTQQTMAQLEQELTGEILLKLTKTAAAIGEEKGYTLVLEKTAVIYQSGGMDITSDVVARHNAGNN